MTTRRRGRGEGGVYQRADGRWEARLDLGWHDGKRRRRSFFGHTRAEAVGKLRAAQARTDKGLPVGDQRTTVAQLLDRWLDLQVHSGTKSDKTVENYEWAIAHLRRGLGRIRLADLSADHVDDFLFARASTGMARNSMLRLRAVLSMALDFAVRRDLVARNVAKMTTTPAGPMRQSRALTPAQATAVLEAARSERFEAAFVTMLMLGLRPGECLGLAWANVDLDRGELRIVQAVKRVRSRPVLGTLKTAGSRRTLAAPAPVVEALRAHRARQAAERLAAGERWTDNGMVFANTIGGLVDPARFGRAFAKVTERAGLGHWHPHELRHSFVSLASYAGVREEDVADVVGHVTTRMTHRVYRHAVTPTITAGKAAMEAMFGDGELGRQLGRQGPTEDGESADPTGLSAV
jgi:integrase